VRSKPLKSGSPPQAVAAGLGYVPAHRLREALFPDFDMTSNLTISNLQSVSRHHLLRKSVERTEMRDWIGELGVVPADPFASVLTMSGGNQQKVVVGRWARPLGRVSVLLLDEPTQGVDVSAREAIYGALRAFVRRGAVIVSSSDSDELCRICDRVLVMYRGEVVAELDRASMSVNAVDSYSLGIGSPDADDVAVIDGH
jgi:ABC-type sugar transport system ATPase subunit